MELRHTNRFYMVRRLAALVGGLRAPTLRFHFGISGRGSAPLRIAPYVPAFSLRLLAYLLTETRRKPRKLYRISGELLPRTAARQNLSLIHI